MTVTFFGHRDTPRDIQPLLRVTLINLIQQNPTVSFLIGNKGAFDRMAVKTLQELQACYPDIRYTVVYAYFPTEKYFAVDVPAQNTVFPDELANIPRKFAIDRRNRLLVERSDVLITYVKHSVGGAAKFKALAEKNSKRVLNLAEMC